MLRVCALAILVAGCQQTEAPPPSCTAIMTHLATILKQDVPGHGDLFNKSKANVQECEVRKLTPTQRRCLAATTTAADIKACNAGRPPAPPAVGSAIGSAR